MKIKIGMLLILFCFSTTARADVYCGLVGIDKIVLNGDRTRGASFANMLLLDLGDGVSEQCKDIDFAYLENTDDAYEGILYLVTQAHLMNKKIRVNVESADKPRISTIEL